MNQKGFSRTILAVAFALIFGNLNAVSAIANDPGQPAPMGLYVGSNEFLEMVER
jgi:hypothetical protein